MAKIRIVNQNNVNIEEEIVGKFSTTNTSVGFDTNYWNPALYVARDHYLNLLPLQETVTDGYNTNDGREGEAGLILGTEGLTYYLTGHQMGLSLENVHNGTVNISGTYFSRTIDLRNCSNLQLNVTSKCCCNGVALWDCNDIEITGDMSYSSEAHIKSDRSTNLNIHDNNLSFGCLSESTGGIYLMGATNSVIEHNRISSNVFGVYWPWDGGSIYMERGSQNNIIRRNTISDCHLALQDNSGCHNIWEQNTLVNCEYSIDVTDAANIGNGIPEYYGNLLVHTPDKSPRNGANGRQIVIQ